MWQVNFIARFVVLIIPETESRAMFRADADVTLAGRLIEGVCGNKVLRGIFGR
jgi:hypothetical protein